MTFVRGNLWILAALLVAGGLVAAERPLAAVAWLGVCLVGNSFFHLYHLHSLNRWSTLPRKRQLPLGIGSWRNFLDRLGRFARQEGEWYYVDGIMGVRPRTAPKIGRNDPCPCGSGKKYKKCHGAAA